MDATATPLGHEVKSRIVRENFRGWLSCGHLPEIIAPDFFMVFVHCDECGVMKKISYLADSVMPIRNS